MAGLNKTPLDIMSSVFAGTQIVVEPGGPLYGTEGNDVLAGSTLSDSFVASKGNDTIDGQDGTDTVVYDGMALVEIVELNPPTFPVIIDSNNGPGVLVDLAAGTANKPVTTYTLDYYSVIATTEVFTDRLFSIENVVGSLLDDTVFGSAGNNVLTGNDGDDVLDGRQGRDTLDGGDGEDSLFGGEGADSLFGGDNSDFLVGGAGADFIDGGAEGSDSGISIGNIPAFLPPGVELPQTYVDLGDFVSYASSASGVTVNLNLASRQIGGDARGDVLLDIESVAGSAFNDTLTVNNGFAYGNGGKDKLTGGDRSDWLVGGEGNDQLYGGGGNDMLVGDDENTGMPGAGIDQLYGGDGDDILVGGAGGDRLYGGNGDDLYVGVEAGDLISDSGGIDTVVTAEGTFTLRGQIENLVFNSGADHLGYGNAANNILAGDHGNDTLFGRDGNDTIYGNGGNDTLIGGAGADVLDGDGGDDLFRNLQGNDTIVFSEGTDRAIGFGTTAGAEQDIIDLSNQGYSSLQDFYDQGGTIQQIGNSTQIQLYVDGPTLILQGVSATSLDETDFWFG